MRINRDEQCLKCGSFHLIKKGQSVSNMKSYWVQRYQCNDCGHKQTGKKRHYEMKQPFQYQSKSVPSQNWDTYTEAQENHGKFLKMCLSELLEKVEFNESASTGRPSASLKDILFSLALKSYTRLSSQRLHSELVVAKQLGFINQIFDYSTLMKYLKREDMSEILTELIQLFSLPLKEIEVDFAIDSAGFSTNQFGRWKNHRNGKEFNMRDYLKCHIIVGVKTNVITYAEITLSSAGDSPQLEKLVEETSKNFQLREVSADAAYSSRKNLEFIDSKGATPYISFKKSTTGAHGGSKIWGRSFEDSKNNPQEFGEHYHKRSNVESTNSMIKQKFGSNLVTKNFQSQKNEILLKILCHNALCLAHEYYEKTIEWPLSTQAPNIDIKHPEA